MLFRSKNNLYDEKNLNFIKDTFFKSNENINISPNTFVIYSSDYPGNNYKLEEYNKTKQEIEKDDREKKEEKQKLSGKAYQITINIKLIDNKEKLSKVEYAKIGCSERAKRIEKEAFELFGISFNLLQNTNMYNPLAVYEKITRTDKERKKEDRKKLIEKKRADRAKIRDEEDKRRLTAELKEQGSRDQFKKL